MIKTLIFLAPLAAASVVPRDTYYCTFWTEDSCRTRSGGTSYATSNPGIIQNGGPFFQCTSSDRHEFSLISYPPGDSAGDHPNHCHVFTSEQSGEECSRLSDFGFTPGDGGYYRFSEDVTCPPTSKVKRNETEEAAEPEVAIQKRDHNYLGFYNDPDCQQQSGSVAYSVKNPGCFENGGAYAIFGGDDPYWHIEQYAATGSEQCTGSIEHCVHSDPFYVHEVCVDLRSVGLNPGFGSYKIGRNGCP